jgi:hypothetical protein
MNIPYIITNNSITVVFDGISHTLNDGHLNYAAVKQAIIDRQFDKIPILVDIPKAINRYSYGNIKIENGAIKYAGQPVHNYICDKIFSFMKEGLPFEPLVAFLDKLMKNPSKRAVNELYSFLEHKAMPVTPNGNFLAYKSVDSNWRDHHTGTFDNSIGNTLEMNRNAVCDDTDIGCSFGFHAGSLEYARSFGGGAIRLLIVEIDPSDVVSIPKDSNCQKLRTCKYKVVAEYAQKLPDHYTEEYSEKQGFDSYTEPCDCDECPAEEEEEAENSSVLVSFHNVRDELGRFTNKTKTS